MDHLMASILMNFGGRWKQVGIKNQAKSEQKAIPKSIEKIERMAPSDEMSIIAQTNKSTLLSIASPGRSATE